MTMEIHADHIDVTGAYMPKYMILRELFDKGMLNDIPDEFKPLKNPTPIENSQQVHTTIVDNVEGASNSWKEFLKQVIAEEKSKLNI